MPDTDWKDTADYLFTDYYMYKSSRANSIWVALQNLQWNFVASTTNNVVRTAQSTLSTNQTSAAVAIASPAQNDLLLAWVAVHDVAAPGQTITAPSGWTQIGTTLHDYGAGAAALFYKTAGAAETGSYSFGWSSPVNQGGVEIVEYSGINTSTYPVDVYWLRQTAAGTTSSTASIAPTSPNELVASFVSGYYPATPAPQPTLSAGWVSDDWASAPRFNTMTMHNSSGGTGPTAASVTWASQFYSLNAIVALKTSVLGWAAPTPGALLTPPTGTANNDYPTWTCQYGG